MKYERDGEKAWLIIINIRLLRWKNAKLAVKCSDISSKANSFFIIIMFYKLSIRLYTKCLMTKRGGPKN